MTMMRWLDAKSRWGEFVDPQDDRFCSSHALKFILPAVAGLGAAVLGPEVFAALGPAEAAGGAALADTAGGLSAADLLAAPATTAASETAALGAPITTSVAEAALPATSSFLTTPPAFGAGSVSGVGSEFAPGGLNAALAPSSLVTTPGGMTGPPPGFGPVTTDTVTSAAGPASVQPGIQPVTTAPPTAAPPVGASTAAPGSAAAAPVAPISSAPSAAEIVSGGGDIDAIAGAAGTGAGQVTLNQPAIDAALAPVSGVNNFNDIMRGAGETLKDVSPILGPAASLGGLGLAIMRSGQQTPYTSNVLDTARAIKALSPGITGAASNISNIAPQIGSVASNLITQGQGLENYLASGTLPPGVKQGLDLATNQAKETIRSRYAATGETGSSAEAADLANLDSVAASQGANFALNLYNSGVSEIASGISGLGQEAQTAGVGAQTLALDASTQGQVAQLYQYLLEQSLAKDQQLGGAIGNFASSLVPVSRVQLAG